VGGRDMKNTVFLSKGKEFKYYAVRLPRGAQRVDYMRTNEGQYLLTYDIPIEQHGFNCSWVECISIPVFDKGVQFWLLGSYGDISEEVVKEVLANIEGKQPFLSHNHYLHRKLILEGVDIAKEKIAIIKTKNYERRTKNMD
jgi:hypothetical protein